MTEKMTRETIADADLDHARGGVGVTNDHLTFGSLSLHQPTLTVGVGVTNDHLTSDVGVTARHDTIAVTIDNTH